MLSRTTDDGTFTWKHLTAILVIAGMVAGAAARVESKANGSDLEKKASKIEVERLADEVRGVGKDVNVLRSRAWQSHYEIRMLIREVSPELADTLEPLGEP